MEKWAQQSLRDPASSLAPLLCSLHPGLAHVAMAVRGRGLAAATVGLKGGQDSRTSLCNSLPVAGVLSSLKALIDSPVPAELVIQQTRWRL